MNQNNTLKAEKESSASVQVFAPTSIPGGSITGTVTGTSGAAIANATVTAGGITVTTLATFDLDRSGFIDRPEAVAFFNRTPV